MSTMFECSTCAAAHWGNDALEAAPRYIASEYDLVIHFLTVHPGRPLEVTA